MIGQDGVVPSDEEVPSEAVPHDVEIETPSYWLTHVAELQGLLTAPHAPTIRTTDPSFTAAEESFVVVNPSYWATNVDALVEVLADPTGDGALIPQVHIPGLEPTEPGGTTAEVPYEAAKRAEGLASGPPPERLTLTVEEAAATLGISRAFAYEAVRRGDIPSIRIGRRILVPHAALNRLLSLPDPPLAAE